MSKLEKNLADNKTLYNYLSANLSKKFKLIEHERNYSIHRERVELFKKYVGLYNVKTKSLIIHHFTDNNSNYPYGFYLYDDSIKVGKVKGSWDKWTKIYELQEIRLNGNQGYVYYINIELDINQTVYQFKLIDTDGYWIEPIIHSDLITELVKDNNDILNGKMEIRIF